MRYACEEYIYKIKEVLKILRIICDLTLMVYYVQIEAYKSRRMLLIKSCNLIRTKCYLCNRFRNVFQNLRSRRETAIVQLIYIRNQSFFLSLCKLLSYVGVRVFNYALCTSKASRKRCTFDVPASSCYCKIHTFLSLQIINRRLNPSVVVHFIAC